MTSERDGGAGRACRGERDGGERGLRFGAGLALAAPPDRRAPFLCQVEMEEFGVAAGQRVAVIWDGSSPVGALKGLVDSVRASVGADGRVAVENVNQLSQCKNHLSFSLSALKGEGSSAF